MIALLIIDAAILFLMYMSSNLCSFALLLVIGHYIMSKTEWFKKQDETGDKQKLYSTVIFLIYDNLNKLLDQARKLMYLESPLALGATILILFIVAVLGKYISSLLIILIAFNVFVIINYGDIKKKIGDAYNKVSTIVSDNANKYIPRYNDGKEVPKF